MLLDYLVEEAADGARRVCADEPGDRLTITLREKLGAETEPYLILGACNPPLAHQALDTEPELGTLLPCNVVVYERHGETHISAIDAERMLSIVDNDELAPIAAQVRDKLARVLDHTTSA